MEIKVISDKENRTREVCELINLEVEGRKIKSKDSFENSFDSICLNVALKLNLNYSSGQFKEKNGYM